jgi:hypothetical protein
MIRLNEMVKKLDTFDIVLIKLSVAAAILLIAKYWTALISLEWYWYVIVFAIAIIRPIMQMFKK